MWVATHVHSWLGARVKNSVLEGNLEAFEQPSKALGSHQFLRQIRHEIDPVSQGDGMLKLKKIKGGFMQFTQKQIDEFKTVWKEVYKQDLNDEQAAEYARQIVGFMGHMLNIAERVHQWDERLKELPQGFALLDKGTYNCSICYDRASGEEGWYDRFGIKCLPCQKAVEDGVVPGEICKDNDLWYSISDLKTNFNLHHTTVRKMIREKNLVARIIKRNGRDHFFVFMKTENQIVKTS